MTDLMRADHLVSRCPFCGSWRWDDFCNTCWPRLRLDDSDEFLRAFAPHGIPLSFPWEAIDEITEAS